MDFLNKLDLNLKLAFAGLVGAVISAKFHPDVQSPYDRVLFVLTGAACAYYLTGMVSAHFDIAASSAGGVGFLLGAFGGSLMESCVRAIRSADFLALIRRKAGNPEGGAE